MAASPLPEAVGLRPISARTLCFVLFSHCKFPRGARWSPTPRPLRSGSVDAPAEPCSWLLPACVDACPKHARGRVRASLQRPSQHPVPLGRTCLGFHQPGAAFSPRGFLGHCGFRPSPVTSSATGAFPRARPYSKLDASPSSEDFRTAVRLLERTQVGSHPHTPDLSTSKHDWVPAACTFGNVLSAKQTDDRHPTVLTLHAAHSPAWGTPWSSVCPQSSGSPAVWVFCLQFQNRSAPCFLTLGTSTHSFFCCFG